MNFSKLKNSIMCELNRCLAEPAKSIANFSFDSMLDNDVIDFTLCAIWKYFGSIERFQEECPRSILLKLLGKLDSPYSKSVEFLINRLSSLLSLDLLSFDERIEETNRRLLHVFDNLNKFLYSNSIPFFHTGGVLAYILTNTALYRKHHDLDIMIDEKDFLRLLESAEHSDFKLVRKLAERKDGVLRQTIHMYYRNFNLPIAVLLSEKLSNGGIYVNDYIIKDGAVLVERDYSTPLCVDLSLSKFPFYYNKTPFYYMTLEALYNCKKTRRPKDLFDCEIMRPFIDESRERIIEQEIVKEHIIDEVRDERKQNTILNLSYT